VIVSLASTVIAFFLFFSKNYDSLVDAFRFATFQVVSIITTTGFATADYELWPMGTQAIILLLMLLGGCAGSTSGGIKLIRCLSSANTA
jgi:Trk-type K+ transport systems, membrane components